MQKAVPLAQCDDLLNRDYVSKVKIMKAPEGVTENCVCVTCDHLGPHLNFESAVFSLT